MTIVYADEFRKQFYKLPTSIQQHVRQQEKIFRLNWRDPRLHTKKLKGNEGIFSFRVTRTYRVLFAFPESETILFVTIGHRKDVYRD